MVHWDYSKCLFMLLLVFSLFGCYSSFVLAQFSKILLFIFEVGEAGVEVSKLGVGILLWKERMAGFEFISIILKYLFWMGFEIKWKFSYLEFRRFIVFREGMIRNFICLKIVRL